jgi:superfamily II DNA or RNA helicase
MMLRPYQAQKVEEVFSLWSSGKARLLLIAPTGSGKTVIFGEVAKRAAAGGQKVLVVCHREELVRQTFSRLQSGAGLPVALDWGEHTANGEPILVSSVLTAAKRCRPADVLIVDEAHHAPAKSFLDLITRYPRVLGCTATPFRGDRQALIPEIFETTVGEPIKIEDLQEHGFLVDVRAKRLEVQVDLSHVRIRGGDFAEEEAAEALELGLQAVVKAALPIIRERNRCVAFVPLVRTSELLCGLFQDEGISAVHVDGKMSDQAARIQAFRDGAYKVLTNALLLTEGVDIPEIDTILLLRPTKSPVLLAQMLGRGLRPASGKKDLLVLDPAWIVEEESPLDVTGLIEAGEVGAHGRLVREGLARGLTLREAKKEADKKISEREISLLLSLQMAAKRNQLDILDWLGVQKEKWSKWTKPASEKQAKWIRSILPASYSHIVDVLTLKEAGKIIEIHLKRRKEELCTIKQAYLILKNGLHPDPLKLSFREARELLDDFFLAGRM